MTDQVAGTILAERYALEDRIGVGGMATVYRAIDLTNGSRVAVKILSKDLLAKNPQEADRNVKRFRREGEILRLLAGNPYVVGFVEQGVSPGGDHYIAMELLEGEQLRFTIGRGKAAMGLRTFAYYAKHLIRGLMEIHAKHLIHRDLAPDNVIVTKTREGLPWPKFLDFGIGKSIGGELDQVTQMLTIMGKPQYFSPEQARGEELTAGSDVYSLGVLLYEMLTGHVPIEVRGMNELRRIQRDAPVPVEQHREGARASKDLRAVIMRCLEKKPADRPSLEEVLTAVERFSDRLDAGEEFPMPEAADPEDATSKLPPAGDQPTIQAAGPARPAAAPLHEFAHGERIGRFEVRERIGRGGMGLVYLAWDPILQREVAIKVASRVEEEKARREILREARASSHLKSDNVVTIYDAGTEAGTPYIAMEYVRGRTLAEILETEGALSGERFWRLASGILDGLIYAHEGEKPVVHRDLKPSNILCAGDVAKIADFGIATLTAQHLTMGARDQSHTGGAEGSVLTVSPEQANNRPADYRSDIYSLGCVLYMMATGRAPFQGNQIAILYQHVTRVPDPPAKVNPELAPAGLSPVIMKCLEKDPAKRWQTVREVKTALEPLFGARGRGKGLRSRAAFVAMAVLVIVGAAAGAWVWKRMAPAPAPSLLVVQIAGTPVRPDRPGASYATAARQIEIELGAQTPGEVRATAVAAGVAPIVRTEKLSRDRTTALRIPLPDPGPREAVEYTVTLERPDQTPAARRQFVVVQDVHDPRVRFRAYGQDHDPTAAPIPVLRIRDLVAVVSDQGGLDESGSIRELPLAWNERRHGASFTRSRKDDKDPVWSAVVDARDRAGNHASVTQPVEVLLPAVTITAPPEGRATRAKTVRVECTASLPDRGRAIAGLDARDLDLGDGAFEAKIVAGTRASPSVAMTRGKGGYAADVPVPDDPAAQDFAFTIEVHFEGDVIARSTQRFDVTPPVVTASCGGVTVSSANLYMDRPRLSVQSLESRAEEIACRVDDGPAGIQGMTVDVRIDGGDPRRAVLDARGGFRLPHVDAQQFAVRIEAADEAGNKAATEFLVVRKGLQVTSVRLGDRAPDRDGRLFVQHDPVALRVAAVGVPPGDEAFVRVFEDGREQQSVRLARLAGEAGLFEAAEIRLFAEGAAAVTRTLRVVFGPDAGSARPYSDDVLVVLDREPPDVSVTADGAADEIRGVRAFSRFPALTVRVRDNVALGETDPARLIAWTRQPAAVPDVVLGPAHVAGESGAGVTDLSFLVEARGRPAAGAFEFKIEAKDRAGNVTARAFTIQVTPPDVTILAGPDRAPIAEFADPGRPLAVKDYAVRVAIRGPADPQRSYLLVVNAEAASGVESRRELALPGGAAGAPVEHSIPLPKAPDGRLLDEGRLVFLLQEHAGARFEELATIRWVLDREAPSWSVARGGRTFTEPERREWIKVSALGDLRITVSDGKGSGFDDHAIVDPANVVGPVERNGDQLVIRLRDDPSFSGLVNREVEFGVRDVAGNETPIALRLARSKEQLSIRRTLTADGVEPIVRDGRIIVDRPELRIVIDNEAVGFQGVKWTVNRGDTMINWGYIVLQEGRAPDPAPIVWPVAAHAEPYAVEFRGEGPGGVQAEPFERISVLVDDTPPAVHLVAGGRRITTKDRPVIRDFRDLRLEVVDEGAGLGADPAVADFIEPSGARVAAKVEPTRDESLFRIFPPVDAVPGRWTIFVTARDRLGNAASRQFEVEVSPTAPPLVPRTGTQGPATSAASRPETNARTVGNDALREKDEERTGVKFKPVRGSADPNAPIRFWMSQTEITNEQFLKFVDAVRKDLVPRELRVWSDLTLVRKGVENMSSRFDDFQREPKLPVVAVQADVALAFAAWTGGRLPAKDEWIGAAGRYLLPGAGYPVFMDHGTPRSGEYWMRDPNFAVVQRTGVREDRRVSTVDLLRFQANAPFGIVGLAGNVAEWVTAEPGGRKVLGTMGGSFKYPYSNEVSGPRLDREPFLSTSDAGIRVVWPAQVRKP